MVKELIRGDIFSTPDKHIIFAVNVAGDNSDGFASLVAERYWPELIDTGGNKLGEVLVHTSQDKTFYAIVCHSFHYKTGWADAPAIIEKAINDMSFPESEEASIVMIGTGYTGMQLGAPTKEIAEVMKRCNKTLNVYSL